MLVFINMIRICEIRTTIKNAWSRVQYERSDTVEKAGYPSNALYSNHCIIVGRIVHVGQVRLLSTPTADGKSTAQAHWNLDALQEVDATPAVEVTGEGAEVAKSIGEVVLTGWSPLNVAQYLLEVVHVGTGLPWWATIAATTVVVRLALAPVVVRLQANAVKINNLRPETDPMVKKIEEARQTGNTALATTTSARMMALYQKHDCNPVKMLFMPFIQIPIFITFFITLRRMTELPVAGMSTEGIFWFQNLTVPDPYYALPVLASLSFMTIMQVGEFQIGVVTMVTIAVVTDWWRDRHQQSTDG